MDAQDECKWECLELVWVEKRKAIRLLAALAAKYLNC